MTIRAIGSLALIALTGTFILSITPANAACGDKCETADKLVVAKKSIKKVRVAHRHHRDSDVGTRDRGSDRAVAKDESKVDTRAAVLPMDVADARAQMTADDIRAKQGADAPAPAESAADTVAPAQGQAVQVVNADELNDVDKAAADGNEPLPKLSAAVANSRAEMRDDGSSPWSQTSTIGKAFIAFGVMLTLASAARMFMA